LCANLKRLKEKLKKRGERGEIISTGKSLFRTFKNNLTIFYRICYLLNEYSFINLKGALETT
jgi:hypothetical protein